MRNPAIACLSMFLAASLTAQSVAAAPKSAAKPATAPAPVAQAPAPETAPAPAPVSTGKDTVFLVRDTVYVKQESGRPDHDLAFLNERRDRFARMQSNGFGLIMSGIATGVGGIALMAIGINRNIAANEKIEDDPWSDEVSSDEGMGIFFLGYLSAVATVPLLTVGIILNRIGNGRRIRYENLIEEHPETRKGDLRLDVAPNALKLSYTF